MKKKSIIFLINGLGIEKPGSYSISLDQDMPNLARTKETSYFTTAITNSLEYRSAYQQFFVGDTYKTELDYIQTNIINENIKTNPVYQSFSQSVSTPGSKLHVFLEPTTDKIVEQINNLVNTLTLDKDKKIYLHLILSQLTLNDYNRLIDIINYIKYHLNEHITVGFVIGKEYLSDELSAAELKEMEKLLFFCSAERWIKTEDKLKILKEQNVIPYKAKGFCANNECFIKNGDTILFFNTRREDYDKFIKCIYDNAPEVIKNEQINLPAFSLIKLFSKYSINSFAEKVVYENSLDNMLLRYQKKALILTNREHVNLVNFYANGLNQVNNPNIVFMILDDTLYNYNNVVNLIDNSDYDLIIFDYYMDTSSTINNLKSGLTKIDKVLGNIVYCSENKHSLFISSLFGIKKEMPLADYNSERVTIDYEMQIPIFFYDYTYPAGKYTLFPGDTNMILSSAMWCLTGDSHLESLIRPKGILKNLFSAFK